MLDQIIKRQSVPFCFESTLRQQNVDFSQKPEKQFFLQLVLHFNAFLQIES